MYSYFFVQQILNIGILQMTGEVTDRFNEITLFGMFYFGKKQLNPLQNCYKINDSFSHRVERLIDLESYCLYVLPISLSDWAGDGLLGHRSTRC